MCFQESYLLFGSIFTSPWMSFVVQHVRHFALTAVRSPRPGPQLSDWSPGRADGQNESEAQG